MGIRIAILQFLEHPGIHGENGADKVSQGADSTSLMGGQVTRGRLLGLWCTQPQDGAVLSESGDLDLLPSPKRQARAQCITPTFSSIWVAFDTEQMETQCKWKKLWPEVHST